MYNVLLRPLKVEDAFTSYRWRNDPDLWKYTSHKPDRYITEQIEVDWIKKILAEKNSCRFAIIVNDAYIGNIQITNIISEVGEYHIFIGEKSFWGKGIATISTQQLIRYARERLNLKRLYLSVNPKNESAIRVYEKCGFEKVSDEIKMLYDFSSCIAPTVSVFMMTYNHELFIKKAIELILVQKTNFDFDIVIGEDYSTDNTRVIIRRISDLYPGKFKLLFHEKNIGAQANQSAVFAACTGKYIAFCEGDDYWTDPCKLQKQVDFLDHTLEYGMVCTNYSKYFQETKKFKRNVFRVPRYSKEVMFADYLLDMSSIGTATVMFRREIYLHYQDELPISVRNEFNVGDTPLWLYIAATSKIAVLPDETAVYRILENSACHFEDPKKHYEFVKRGFEIADYFIQRYGLGNKNLATKLEIKKLRADLFHGFKTLDWHFTLNVIKKLLKHKIAIRFKILACLYLIGSANKVTNNLVRGFLKLNKFR
jgi:RimJ/RimL family protein N-acetyltransferase/glycosyltransferase involved in cell wall biosynthesis